VSWTTRGDIEFMGGILDAGPLRCACSCGSGSVAVGGGCCRRRPCLQGPPFHL